MKVVNNKGGLYIQFERDDGTLLNTSIDYLRSVTNWESLIEEMINYCSGKKVTSSISWFGRCNKILRTTLVDNYYTSIPSSSQEWTLFIRDLYASVLISGKKNKKLETKVKEYNSNLRPFLVYAQNKAFIPLNVIIPYMKKAFHCVSNSNFEVSILGETSPKVALESAFENKYISKISLHRSDAEYLDELHCDIEKKRNAIYSCLLNYWHNMKAHFDYGESLITNIDTCHVEERLSKNLTLNSTPRPGRVPPIRRHFLAERNETSLAYLLYAIKRSGELPSAIKTSSAPYLPSSTSLAENANYYESLLPNGYIENLEIITLNQRFRWCLGLISIRDIAFLLGLLIMDNPKFTFESLLKCEGWDKDGKPRLSEADNGHTFKIEKSRAKAFKIENISELSKEILNHLYTQHNTFKKYIAPNSQKYLFLHAVVNKSTELNLTLPSTFRVSKYLTGRNGKSDNDINYLNKLYPSLSEKNNLQRGHISHKKLRNTEGLLEWFRTGSIKAASRKLGNTEKTALEHYLPQPLVMAFNTRKVRQFQNLLIAASTANEEYLLDAVDFKTIEELHLFIQSFLELDSKQSNPLLTALRGNLSILEEKKGELLACISLASLSILFTYEASFENSKIEASSLNMADFEGVSPLAILSLSKYLRYSLENSRTPSNREMSNQALNRSKELASKLNWGDLIIKSTVV